MNHSPYLLRLVRAGKKKETGYCSDKSVFYLVFEKPYQSLKEESLLRKSRRGKFTEEEVECVMEAGVKAIYILRQMEHPHNHISTSNFYIREDRTILLGDPWVASRNEALDFQIDGYTYPSPEKILYCNALI